MKHSAEYVKFTSLVEQVMSVPKSVVKERMAEYQKQVDANPKRRGPKRKNATSASGRAAKSSQN
jgi:hypothetical protein